MGPPGPIAFNPMPWFTGQREAFRAALNGASLAVSLDILIATAIQQTHDGRRCAFYIADDKGGLQHVTGMPLAYAERVAGFKIDPDGLACGLAVSTGRLVSWNARQRSSHDSPQ